MATANPYENDSYKRDKKLCEHTGGSATVDFVESPDLSLTSHFMTTICAFANTAGGVVYVGTKSSRVEFAPGRWVWKFEDVVVSVNVIEDIAEGVPSRFVDSLIAIDVQKAMVMRGSVAVLAVSVHRNMPGSLSVLSNGKAFARDGLENKETLDRLSGSHSAVPQSRAPMDESLRSDVSLSDTMAVRVESVSAPSNSTRMAASESSATQPEDVGSGLLLRRESRGDIVALNAGEYSGVIASALRGSRDDEKVTMAIFGHWGRGKTFLADKIAKTLGNPSEMGTRYDIVRFSAWKFRTTPEIWAYLFEEMKRAAERTSWTIPWRALASRHRWSLLLAIVMCAFSLVPNVQKIEWAYDAVRLVGAGCAVYIIGVALHFYRAGVRLWKLRNAFTHSETLGLQAAIGDDLRALLKAWVRRSAGSSVASGSPSVEVTWWGRFSQRVLRRRKNHSIGRILLVVDDLDRCEPCTMLEIIESLLLILDDDEIGRRLQILMLIDEDSFGHAVLKKYRREHVAFTSDGQTKETVETEALDRQTKERRKAEALDRQIVRENREKFFLVHLRLAPLDGDEIAQVVQRFVDELAGGSEHYSGGAVPPRAKDEADTSASRLQSVTAEDVGSLGPKVTTSPIREPSRPGILGEREKRVLSERISQRLADVHDDRIGPRAIRCILFRYELARSIMQKRQVSFEPDALVDEVVDAYLDPSKASRDAVKMVS